MRQEQYKRNDEIWTRVSVTKARKLYDSGKEILIAPVNANMYFGFTLYGRYSNATEWEFDRLTSDYRYFNCNSELGSRLKYFEITPRNEGWEHE